MKEVEAARMTPLLKAAHFLTLFLSTVFNGSIASTLSGHDCGFSEILIVERFMADEILKVKKKHHSIHEDFVTSSSDSFTFVLKAIIWMIKIYKFFYLF